MKDSDFQITKKGFVGIFQNPDSVGQKFDIFKKIQVSLAKISTFSIKTELRFSLAKFNDFQENQNPSFVTRYSSRVICRACPLAKKS